MVVAGERAPEHRVVRDLPGVLREGDLLVLNATRVLPARLCGFRADTGGRIDGLYLGTRGEQRSGPDARAGAGEDARWVVLLKGRRLREGVRVALEGPGGNNGVSLRLVEPWTDEPGGWLVEPEGGGAGALGEIGRTPLPPYIVSARKHAGEDVADEVDRERYQTVFAGEAGSVAAPTAGLHLTSGLLEALRAAGVRTAEVVLHVGTGTFRPVEAEWLREHPMHAEWGRVPEATAAAVESARREGRRVIAVGTTACRALESFAVLGAQGEAKAGAWFSTRLLIAPGHEWRWTDGLLTNFHLPRSTLLAMVAARTPGGLARVKALYAQAIAAGYRFFSYGDAMLVLP
jgi:S-adenosylmethionine:tRNA ribosyltransferase-isomerase